METIVIALIGAFSGLLMGTIPPAILLYMKTKSDREMRAEDWARQDAVAAKTEKVAVLLEKEQVKTDEARESVSKKLDVIHTLVNSNMTAAMQSEFDATTRELAMMVEVVGLKKAAGHETSPEASAAIVSTQSKLAELRAALDDRVKQSKIVEKQASG